MTDTTTRGIGDNKPPLPTPEEIAADLAERHAKFVARAAEIVEKLANVPAELTTQDESDKASEFVKACMTFDGLADSTREEEKAPYWNGGKAVDAFFANLRGKVAIVRTQLKARTTAYDVKKLNEENAERARQAKAAQEAADIAAMQAKKAQTEEGRIDALAAKQDADDAIAATAVKPAEITRTRTATGVTRSLTVTWKHEVTDAKKVPKKYLAPSAALIDAAIKAATTEDRKCTLEIPGVRIYPDYDSRVR